MFTKKNKIMKRKELIEKDMEKEDIKNEIENFIIYHCGSNDEQLTYLLTCLDAYIDNDHIINE